MKKQVINRLFIPFTHVASIRNTPIPPSKLIQSLNPSPNNPNIANTTFFSILAFIGKFYFWSYMEPPLHTHTNSLHNLNLG